MAILIDEVIGHEQSIQQLDQLVLSKRWPQALIFVGPESVGKKKIALAYAQTLICELKGSKACGVCGSCIRVAKEQSENLKVLSTESGKVKDTTVKKANSKSLIKIEQVRDVLYFLSLSQKNQNRVIIIDEAELLNPQAANALLKTLEEPTDNVYFILITSELNSLLATIRSRAQIIRFKSLSETNLAQIQPKADLWAYKSARGQIEKLKSMIQSDQIAKRTDLFHFFESFWTQKDFLNQPDWRDKYKERSKAVLTLNFWLEIVRDLMVMKTGDEKSVIHHDQNQVLQKLMFISSDKLSFFSEALIQAEKDIQHNSDSVLVLENLWVTHARAN